ncbi:MAG: hypothetical protein ACI9T8_000529 [Candidatus Saccharimonadales bacterium]|jgi:hypothetical protein
MNNDFKPELSPKEMLEMGVFDGDYFDDVPGEFPPDWFDNARLSKKGIPDPKLNYYGVSASQPRSVWEKKGWIHPNDPLGWFQWYCRYYLGRRNDDDDRQIKRWRAMRRHIAQIEKNCETGDLNCRRKQRQAILHWAYDSRNIKSIHDRDFI